MQNGVIYSTMYDKVMYGHSRRSLRESYVTGRALIGHTNDAHGGRVVETCNACQEIIRKQKQVQGESQ